MTTTRDGARAPSVHVDLTAAQAAPAPDADAARIGAALSTLVRASMKMKERLHARSVEQGTDFSAYAVLRPLVERGPMRISTVADALHLNVSSVSRHVTQLIAEGLLERRADAADGRACIVAPTPAGLRAHDRTRALRDRHLDRLLSGWDDADRAALATLLPRLADAVEADLGVHQEIS